MAFDNLFCPRSRSSASRKSASHHNQNISRQNEAQQQQQADNNNTTQHHRQTTHHADGNNNNANISNNTNDNTNSNNTNNGTGNNMNGSGPYLTCRYVTAEFRAVEPDELSVCPGDIVLFEFSDIDQDNKSWAHVLCLTRNERGFVPSYILSSEPKLFTQCIKKKLPRSMADLNTIDHHPHHLSNHHISAHHTHLGRQHHQQQHHQRNNHHSGLHGGSHSHKTHCTSERTCHSHSGSINLHHHQSHHRSTQHVRGTMDQATTPQFDLAANSLQGSSGCQTFQNYPEFSQHFSPPSYYNVGTHPPPMANMRYEDFRPFHILHYHKVGIGQRFVVMHNFVAREENDLEVKPGDYVVVLNNDDKDWYWVEREYDHREGFVPARFICPFEQVQSVLNKGNSTITMKSSNQMDLHTYFNHQPEPESVATDQQSSVFKLNS